MSVEASTNDNKSWFGRMPLWGRVVLIGSVALNLLIVGSLIGMGIGGHSHGWHGERKLLRHIAKDQRDDIRGILRKHREDVRPLRQEIRKNRRAVVDYLRQETIDAQKLESMLVALEEQHKDVRDKLRAMIMELSVKLKPEDRARIVNRVLRGKRWRHGRRHRH